MRRLAVVAVLAGCIPALGYHRPERAFETRKVEGVTVRLVPSGYVAWTMFITNDRPDPVFIVWDESTFVAGDRVSQGRLIRGETRVIHSAQSQPPTPLPGGGSTLVEFVAPERLLSYVPPLDNSPPKLDKKGNKIVQNGAPPSLVTGVGRMLITFNTKDGIEYWEAKVFLDGVVPPKIEQPKEQVPEPEVPEPEPVAPSGEQ